MAYTPTPVDRAGAAVRRITSLCIAAQLISSGSSLPTEREINHLVIDLLDIAEFIGKIGQTAFEEVEAAIATINSSTMTS